MDELYLTLSDVNQLLNYGDIRASEFDLVIQGERIASEAYITSFLSDQDLITDLVCPRRLREILDGQTSFVICIRRNYPFHRALIKNSVDLSVSHEYAYTPRIIVGQNCSYQLPVQSLPLKRFYRGHLLGGDVLRELPSPEINFGSEKTVLSIYEPNSRLHSEVSVRILRRELRENTSGIDDARWTSISDEAFLEKSADISSFAEHISEKPFKYFQTLMQIWPCGSFGRLSSYLLLDREATDLSFEKIPWLIFSSSDGDFSVGGRKLDSRLISELGAFGHFANLSPQGIDQAFELVKSGAYRLLLRNDWYGRGWSIANSSRDPAISVRSDGSKVWMCHPHGGVESIYRINDGKNLAVGSRYIEENFLETSENTSVLFGGLGLGVMQRNLSASFEQVTVELNPAVIEMFEEIHDRSKVPIVQGDVLTHNLERDFDLVVLDFFDPDNECLKLKNVTYLFQSIKPNGRLIINKNSPDREAKEMFFELSSKDEFITEVHELRHGQVVLEVTKSGASY